MRKLSPRLCSAVRCGSVLLLYGILATLAAGADPEMKHKQLRRFHFEQTQMGVAFQITLYACDSEVANHAARAAFGHIAELNTKLSDYDSASEVRQLCRRTPGIWHPVSTHLHRVLLHASRLSVRTQGAFDVTVGHYTKLWRRARRRNKLPPGDDLKSIARVTGYRFLQVDPRNPQVRLAVTGMRIDLGGIAKGYAVDEALQVLSRAGIERALVDGSGDIAVGKPPPDRNGWRIEIQSLRDSPAADPVSVELANCAVATSGDAFQHVEIAGRRYSHILDARTGQPLTTPSSVTVIAPTGIAADSLASSISVLGATAGIRDIAALAGVEAYVVTVRNGKVHSAQSSGFGALVPTVHSAPGAG